MTLLEPIERRQFLDLVRAGMPPPDVTALLLDHDAAQRALIERQSATNIELGTQLAEWMRRANEAEAKLEAERAAYLTTLANASARWKEWIARCEAERGRADESAMWCLFAMQAGLAECERLREDAVIVATERDSLQASFDAEANEADRLRTVLRTGGAMYRAERVALGCPIGGFDESVENALRAELARVTKERDEALATVRFFGDPYEKGHELGKTAGAAEERACVVAFANVAIDGMRKRGGDGMKLFSALIVAFRDRIKAGEHAKEPTS